MRVQISNHDPSRPVYLAVIRLDAAAGAEAASLRQYTLSAGTSSLRIDDLAAAVIAWQVDFTGQRTCHAVDILDGTSRQPGPDILLIPDEEGE